MQQFWIVWREGSDAPVVKHFDESVARNEAERLARLHAGVFHVLEVVGSCKRHDIDWTHYDGRMKESEIPF